MFCECIQNNDDMFVERKVEEEKNKEKKKKKKKNYKLHLIMLVTL